MVTLVDAGSSGVSGSDGKTKVVAGGGDNTPVIIFADPYSTGEPKPLPYYTLDKPPMRVPALNSSFPLAIPQRWMAKHRRRYGL